MPTLKSQSTLHSLQTGLDFATTYASRQPSADNAGVNNTVLFILLKLTAFGFLWLGNSNS